MSGKITTEFHCQNIAPIEKLDRIIKSNSLKFGVFANNGSGKTFISRVFRLTEKADDIVLDEEGNCSTDKLISLGKERGYFNFKITDKDGVIIESFEIDIKNKEIPQIPDTNYLFHVFNEDYVDENLRSLDYDKDDHIDGYILGKVNIDISDEEEELRKIEKEGIALSTQVENEIIEYRENNIDDIQNIKRLNEYRQITPEYIIQNVDKTPYGIDKSSEELIEDYNKVKSVPENLSDISNIESIEIDYEFLRKISENCENKFVLSDLAEDFKNRVKERQDFIEKGVTILESKDEKNCPFCEQKLEDDALSLIDKYTEYLNDVEANTIKILKIQKGKIESYIIQIEKIQIENVKRIISYNTYKEKYIPSMGETELSEIKIESISSLLNIIIESLDQKLENISKSVIIDNDKIESIEKYETILNGELKNNNELIDKLNGKKNSLNNENKSIRKQLCNKTIDELILKHKTNIKTLLKLRSDHRKLKSDIERKKEQEKVSKKKKVASTIKSVLNYFFNDKYNLDEETFRLTFNENILERSQAKDVLSAGEKNIIAFAYYIGDTHLKVNSEDDYKKLFFIIDDPISSMDFSHVYTVCGVIRDLKEIIDKLDRERFMIFTHNNDFMRILSSNNIVDKKLLLSNGELIDFNNNLTIPYISHLIDIYKIARKEGVPDHTTANSIRHILETLTKFESIDLHKESLADYIKEYIPQETKSYTLIQDLSHGGWRTEQAPITNQDYTVVCETIITHIEGKFKGQIEYCETSS